MAELDRLATAGTGHCDKSAMTEEERVRKLHLKPLMHQTHAQAFNLFQGP